MRGHAGALHVKGMEPQDRPSGSCGGGRFAAPQQVNTAATGRGAGPILVPCHQSAKRSKERHLHRLPMVVCSRSSLAGSRRWPIRSPAHALGISVEISTRQSCAYNDRTRGAGLYRTRWSPSVLKSQMLANYSICCPCNIHTCAWVKMRLFRIPTLVCIYGSKKSRDRYSPPHQPMQPPAPTPSAASADMDSPIRPPSPPARPPHPGTTETLCYRRSRPRQQSSRRLPRRWPLAHDLPTPLAISTTPTTTATATATATSTTTATSSSTAVVEKMLTTLAEWTEGTRPGSAEWIQALRAKATLPTGYAAEWMRL